MSMARTVRDTIAAIVMGVLPSVVIGRVRAFSSEVAIGSRKENASKQKSRAPF
jgi:hypothetical protein